VNASLQVGTVTSDISKFISSTTIKSVSPEVREIAKLHLLDGLATMLGGASEESSRILSRHLYAPKKAGQATVLGRRSRFSVERAALINGFQGHVLDYDDAKSLQCLHAPWDSRPIPPLPCLRRHLL
jgi:2-methylcitrate dehydratase PrpD